MSNCTSLGHRLIHTMLNILMNYNLFTSTLITGFQLLACIVRVERRIGYDQLASEKPADLHLHCFQSRIYPGPV